MESDLAADGRIPGKRVAVPGFIWVSSSPSPVEVARLEESFPEVVCLPETELGAEVEFWHQRAIIARSFHRWVPAEALIREFRRAGVPGEIVPVNLAFRCHIFRFDSPEARNLVLQRPWVVNGQVIGTEAWRPEFIPAEDSVPSALVWVRLPNLPMEFWKESFLRAIMEPAGGFVAVDSATLAKNRGGFARVCLRIDLSHPLRPGVRVQGSNQPFWQQFIYESLEGICMRCGSLHLGGFCLNPEKTEGNDSVSSNSFGPWLLAVRQRKAASAPQVDSKGKTKSQASKVASAPRSVSLKEISGQRSGTGVQADGWASPSKLARRRFSSALKMVVDPVPQLSEAGVNLEKGIKEREAVPVKPGRAVSENAESQLLNVKIGGSQGNSLKTRNPFASLESDMDVADHLDSRDVSSGPSKRARPEASSAPRSSSKSDK